MAKRRRHRRSHRGYGDIISVPSFSGIGSAIKDNKGLLIGTGLAVGGGYAVKYLLKQFPSIATYIPTAVAPFMPAISAALTGVVAYAMQKKKSPTSAKQHLAGALAAAAAFGLSEAVTTFVPSLAGYTTAPDFGVVGRSLPGPMGVLLPSAMNGLQMAGADMAESDEISGGF
jgi:hypothetical protein